MAIPLEELAAGALEGIVGPVTLAVGASAIAVALAAGSSRPLRRIAATTVVAAERTGQIALGDWFAAAKRGWLGLVAEARAEYESGRQGSRAVAASPVIFATATEVAPEVGTLVVVPSSAGLPPTPEQDGAEKVRDRRGRFVRRAANGVRSE